MSNTYCLINCEGNIFVIYLKNKEIMAEILLEDGTGKISFKINKFSIIKYLNNDIKLNDILDKSSLKTVELYNYSTKSILQINKKQVGKLSCGDEYYTNLVDGMKLSFEKRIELAVRVNYIPLDYKKIMDLVKHYYFLKEKLDLLYFTFGDHNFTKKQCEKQLNDLKHYFIDIEIPFEFVSTDEIEKLNIDKVCLKEDCNFDLIKIGKKDINNITNKEMNYMVYRLSDLIANLNNKPRFWSKRAKNKYIEEYKDHYYPFKRNIVIDDILK